jgi:putative membrane protein
MAALPRRHPVHGFTSRPRHEPSFTSTGILRSFTPRPAMHTGPGYTLPEFLHWTRRKLYVLIALGTAPVLLYQYAGLRWVALPWTFAALLGTAAAFIIGFRNTQTYAHTVEAQQLWSAIAASSRAWGAMSRDFPRSQEKARGLIHRHLAWLTALRYQMRESRPWEGARRAHDAEYASRYRVPERESPLAAELAKFVPAGELSALLGAGHCASRLLGAQSAAIRALYDEKEILINHVLELQKTVTVFYDQQARCERLKNFPYPRQYAVVNTIFVCVFCLLLPFGMLREFERLGESVGGFMQGHMVWLVVPFSVLISWMYVSLEQVGGSTENPFEGSANDVPISQMCRAVEIELRGMLGESELPPPLLPENHILL